VAEVSQNSRRGALDKKFVVARTRDIPEGARVLVTVQGREIGVFNVDGKFHAILNRCPHRGGELCKGDVLGFVHADRPGAVTLRGTAGNSTSRLASRGMTLPATPILL
jgi:hypothetical protein